MVDPPLNNYCRTCRLTIRHVGLTSNPDVASNVRFTSIVLKNSIFRFDHNLEDCWQPRRNFRGGFGGPTGFAAATLPYALPSGLWVETTRRARKRDSRGRSISEFFTTIRRFATFNRLQPSSPSKAHQRRTRGPRRGLPLTHNSGFERAGTRRRKLFRPRWETACNFGIFRANLLTSCWGAGGTGRAG